MHYQIENVSYDSIKGIIHKNGNDIELTKLQSKLLNFYLDNPNTIHSKTTIMKSVWGRIITNNSVDQINSILRSHIEKNPSQPKAIVSHFSKGISFEGSIVEIEHHSHKKNLKHNYILSGLVVFALVIIGWYFLTSYKQSTKISNPPPNPTVNTQSNRLIFFPSANSSDTVFDQNSATQMLISELLRFSSDNDVVDTSRYQGLEKKQQLLETLLRLNTKMNVVHTQLLKEDDSFRLLVKINNGENTLKKQEFSGSTLYEVVLNAVPWISQQNSSQNLDEDLLNLLPNNKYLVETYMRGFSFLNSGEHDKAIEYFKLCLQEKPDFHLARVSLAQAYRRFSHYDEAIAQLKTLKSFKLNTNLAIVVDSEFAAVELIRGNLQQAKNLFESIIHNYPLSFRLYPAYMNLAATHYRMGNYDHALKLLTKLELDINAKTHPEDAALVAFTLSGVYMYQMQLDKAHHYLQKSFQLFKQANDIQRAGMALARISNYYKMIGELTKAENYIQQSFDIANQLDNKRSKLAALNHMVDFKIIKGQFDQASKLNTSLSLLATEMNSLPGKIAVAQWWVQLSIEKKNFQQAQKFIEKHLQLTQERGSNPSLNSNLILQLQLALKLNDNPKSNDLVKKLQQLKESDSLQISYIPLYAKYLSLTHQPEEVIEYLESKKMIADKQKDYSFKQYLSILIANEYLSGNPKKAVQILKKIKVNESNYFPYYSLFAKALFVTKNPIEALLQMEKAKQTYHQRWDQTLQALYLKIKLSVKT